MISWFHVGLISDPRNQKPTLSFWKDLKQKMDPQAHLKSKGPESWPWSSGLRGQCCGRLHLGVAWVWGWFVWVNEDVFFLFAVSLFMHLFFLDLAWPTKIRSTWNTGCLISCRKSTMFQVLKWPVSNPTCTVNLWESPRIPYRSFNPFHGFVRNQSSTSCNFACMPSASKRLAFHGHQRTVAFGNPWKLHEIAIDHQKSSNIFPRI